MDICQPITCPPHCVRTSDGGKKASELLQHSTISQLNTKRLIYTERKKQQTIMSLSTAPGIMLKRTVFNPRLATVQPLNVSRRAGKCAAAAATRGSYRTVHHSARLPAITPSETRHRPSLRPHQQPASYSRVTGSSPSSKRTIFIQTESTPNPDVSFFFGQVLFLDCAWRGIS